VKENVIKRMFFNVEQKIAKNKKSQTEKTRSRILEHENWQLLLPCVSFFLKFLWGTKNSLSANVLLCFFNIEKVIITKANS